MLQRTLAHELGHALGLAHPVLGPNSGIVMQCRPAGGEYIRTGTDDGNGAHHLYSSLYANYGNAGVFTMLNTWNSRLTRSSRLVSLVLTSVALGATVVGCAPATGPTGAPPQSAEAEAAATVPPLQASTHNDVGVEPAYRGLTAAQKLDRVLTLPGRRGFMKGVVGSATTQQLPDMRPDMSVIVTDFAFRVDDFVGRGVPPYQRGSTITLRVPGGTVGAITSSVEDVPALHSGQILYVDMRDQGEVAGGNTPRVQVVSSAADAFEVRGGIVVGHGAWEGFAEDEATFGRHFLR